MSALFWVLIVATVVLGGMELLSTNLVFGSLALGALVAAGMAALDLSPLVVGGVGAVVAGLSLLALRRRCSPACRRAARAAQRHPGSAGSHRQGADRGSRGVVNVSGQEWSAVEVNGSELVAGSKVWVVEVDGATLVVAEDG